MMKNKIFIVALISLMMVAGLLLSCKEDEPCCTAADFDKWETLAQMPQCCQDVLNNVDALEDEPETEAEIRALLGCCYDAFEA
jgi:hypothetical protein